MREVRILILLVVITLFSCGGSHYEVYQSNDISDPWMASDTLSFQLSPSQIENRKLEVVIQHTGDFKFENIYLRCSSNTENTAKIFSIPLANNKGQWAGKKKGNRYTVSHRLGDFPLEKDMTLKVTHQAREEALRNVESVALGILESPD